MMVRIGTNEILGFGIGIFLNGVESYDDGEDWNGSWEISRKIFVCANVLERGKGGAGGGESRKKV